MTAANVRPSLGIAIPSFGHGRYVADTLASLRQLTVPFEAVIQDGGSDESTLSTIRGAIAGDERFRLVSEPDSGQANAINRALEPLMRSHHFVTWVNTDDLIHPHGLAAALDAIAQDDRAVACFGDYLTIDADGLVLDFVRPPRRVTRWLLLYGWNVVPGVATVIRSSALERVGLLDEGLNFAMDYDLWVRLASVGRLVSVDQPVFSFRAHEGSKTIARRDDSLAEERLVASKYRRLPAALAGRVVQLTRASLIARRAVGNRGYVQRSTGESHRQQTRPSVQREVDVRQDHP